MSKVQLFTAVHPSSVQFSKPVKTTAAYKVYPTELPLIQTDHVSFAAPIVDGGDILSKTTIRISPKMQEWIRSVEKHVLQYTKENKASFFHDSVTDDFIDSGFQSSLGKDASLSIRISPDVTVYSADKTTLPLLYIKAGTRACVMLTLNSIEFGKKTFGIRWVLMAAKATSEVPYCFVEDDVCSEDDSEATDEEEQEKKSD